MLPCSGSIHTSTLPRGIPKSEKMSQAGEEQNRQAESGSGGGNSQPQGQSFYGQSGDYYEAIEQTGGGSAASGRSRQARMQHTEQMGIVPMHLSELIPTHPHHISQDNGVSDIPQCGYLVTG